MISEIIFLLLYVLTYVLKKYTLFYDSEEKKMTYNKHTDYI